MKKPHPYKEALKGIRQMASGHRTRKKADEEDSGEGPEGSPEEEAGESAEEEKGEGDDGELSVEEKRAAMYGKRPAPKKGGIMMIIAAGKKPPFKGKK